MRIKLESSAIRNNWHIILLFGLALLTRFLFLSYPAEVVFDEVHFGKFVSAYFTNQYYFDIHPPLGKMMIAGFAKIAGINDIQDPEKAFSQIGEHLVSGHTLFLLRFLPALFGAFFVVLMYWLIVLLGFTKRAAFLGSFLILFDNAFLVESRFILVDIFLVSFGVLALCFFFIAKKYPPLSRKNIIWLVCAAIASALAFSIKWTGLSFWGSIVALIAFDFFKTLNVKRAVAGTLIFTAIPFLVYFSIFTTHLKILYKSGPGDAYMSAAFQKSLAGNTIQENVAPLSLWRKFTELNKAMYSYNAGLKATHPYSSKWYQWPLAKRPIWYWVKTVDDKTSNIYLIANPIVWWLALVALLIIVFGIFTRTIRKKMSPLVSLFLFGYLLSLLPFISVSRVTFLYHYLPPMVFGILMVALVYDTIFEENGAQKSIPLTKKKDERIFIKTIGGFPSKESFFVYIVILLLVIFVFVLLSPLTYGFPTSGWTKIFDTQVLKMLN